jgi:hypothetical protein
LIRHGPRAFIADDLSGVLDPALPFAALRALGVTMPQARGEAASGLPGFEGPRLDGGAIAAVRKSGEFGDAGLQLKTRRGPPANRKAAVI